MRQPDGGMAVSGAAGPQNGSPKVTLDFERPKCAFSKFATVRQPDGGTAVNGAAGPQNGSPKVFFHFAPIGA